MIPLPGRSESASDDRHLAEINVRLNGILNAALDCIITVDSEGRVIEFNPAAEKTFMYAAKEVIGRDMAELVIPPPFRAMHHAGMQRHLSTGEMRVLGRRLEITAMRADRSEFPCELTITRLQIAGLPVFTAFLRDITERKKAEADIQLLNANLETEVAGRTGELRTSIAALETTRVRLEEAQAIGQIGDIEVDLTSLERFWSAEVFRLYGFPQAPTPPPLEEVIARVHPSHQPAFREYLDLYQHSNTEKSLEFRMISPSGAIKWIFMRARVRQSSLDAKRILGITVQDITQRKTLERELLATIEKERELGRLKTSFLQMVTHEYRTPLGIITSSAEILERYFDRLDHSEKAAHLQEIRGSARRLADLLEDVLFLGKTDSGLIVLQAESIELKSWLQRIVLEVSTSLGAEREIAIKVSPKAARVMLDERLLRHIMINLVSNALKYSTLDRPVSITAAAENDYIIFSIVDQGIGIPASDQKKLFQMFQRASNVGTISGSGLGLAIVKRCVDLHDGTVTIDSQPGRGTAVTLRLTQPQSRI